MSDPLETLLVETKWHPVEIIHDREGFYVRETTTGNGIAQKELLARYNWLLREREAAQHSVQRTALPLACGCNPVIDVVCDTHAAFVTRRR